LRRKLLAPPRLPRGDGLRLPGDEDLPVPAHGRLAALPGQGGAVRSARPLADDVPEVDHAGDAAGGDVLEHGAVRREIAVHVGDQGDALAGWGGPDPTVRPAGRASPGPPHSQHARALTLPTPALRRDADLEQWPA